MTLREDLEAAIRGATFTEGDVAASILAELRPVIGVSTTDGPVTLGASKIGGKPHLPRGSTWPQAPREESAFDDEDDDEPTELAFVAQINLADVASEGVLPASGLLSLFVSCEQMDLEPEIRSAVLYTADTRDLVELDVPEGVPSPEGRFEEEALRIGPSFMLLDEDGRVARHDYDDEELFDELLARVANPCTSHMLGGAHFWDEDLDEAYREEGDVVVLKFEGEMLSRLGDDSSLFCESSFVLLLAADKARAGQLDETLVVYEGGS